MQINRRTFIRTSALSGAALSVLGGTTWGQSAGATRMAFLSHTPDQPFPFPVKWAGTAPFRSLEDADFRRLLQRADIDLIVAHVAARDRASVAQAAMLAGKPIAFTEPVGQTVGQVMKVMQTHQATGIPCVLLDDDQFDRDVLAVSGMVQQQQFGTLSYVHCGTTSPTGGLGAAMTWLGINRGNQFTTLNACLSKSWGLHEPAPVARQYKNGPIVRNYELGEVVTITLQCTNGQTVAISRDLSGHRPYSRGFRVQGDKGYWMQDNDLVMRAGVSEPFSAVRSGFDHAYWQSTNRQQQPAPNALGSLAHSLQTGTLPAHSTRDALTISLVQVVTKLSLDIWGDDVEMPSLSLSA